MSAVYRRLLLRRPDVVLLLLCGRRLGLAQIGIRIVPVCLLHRAQKQLCLLADRRTAALRLAAIIQHIDLRPNEIHRTQHQIRYRRAVDLLGMTFPDIIKNILHGMSQR